MVSTSEDIQVLELVIVLRAYYTAKQRAEEYRQNYLRKAWDKYQACEQEARNANCLIKANADAKYAEVEQRAKSAFDAAAQPCQQRLERMQQEANCEHQVSNSGIRTRLNTTIYELNNRLRDQLLQGEITPDVLEAPCMEQFYADSADAQIAHNASVQLVRHELFALEAMLSQQYSTTVQEAAMERNEAINTASATYNAVVAEATSIRQAALQLIDKQAQDARAKRLVIWQKYVADPTLAQVVIEELNQLNKQD